MTFIKLGRFCLATLIERRDISDRLAVFRFKPEDQLGFIAGQYATLAVNADKESLKRPYSIASSPNEQLLEFFIELVPAGRCTPTLWEMMPGSTILIRRRIVGQFTLDRTVNHHLLLATVTGVAPFVSLLRTQRTLREAGAASGDQFVLIQGASQALEFGPYLGELEELARRGWLTYIPTISRPWEDPDWSGETGRVEDVVRKHADQTRFWSGPHIRLCLRSSDGRKLQRDSGARSLYIGSDQRRGVLCNSEHRKAN